MIDVEVTAALRRHAHALTSIRPGSGFGDLDPVRDLVAGARVVGLGEAAHGASEHFVLKHRLIELLVDQEGFTHIAFEASEAGFEAIDAVVAAGEGDLASALTGQGYSAWDTEEVAALLEGLRRHNTVREGGEPVHVVGLDHGFNAWGRRFVQRYLEASRPDLLPDAEAAFADLDGLEARWPSRLAGHEDALERAWQHVTRLAGRLRLEAPPGPDRDRAVRALDRMAAWTGPERFDRSRLMGENVLALLDREPEAKVVVWAHNSHVAVGQSDPGPNLGEVLRGALGPEYVAIGLELGEGTSSARREDPDGFWGELVHVAVPPPPEGSLPWHLARLGSPLLLLDLRSARTDAALATWLQQEHEEHDVWWLEQPPRVERRATGTSWDAIAFVDRVSPTTFSANAIAAAARREGF